MMRWIAVGSGVLLAVAGLVIIVANVGWVMSLAGGAGELPSPQQGSLTWVGVGFARMFGAALIAIGIVTAVVSRLEGEAARKMGVPLALGLAVLMLLGATQAYTVWNTPVAWALWAVVAMAWGGAFTRVVTKSALQTRK